MNGAAAMYSKTRLGSDQIEGSLSLSPRGKRIVYVIVAIVVAAGAAVAVWSGVSGDKYATSSGGPTVELTHRECGAPVFLELACADGHVLESARDVTPVPGPGARRIA